MIAPVKPAGPLTAAAMAVAPVVAAAALGNLATMPNIPGWYEGLAKPALTPPNWVFGPAWTILYILMAFAFYRVLRLDPATPGRRAAITIFLAQLALNASWSFAFFAAHSPIGGLMVIVPMEALILYMIAQFWRLDRVAACCLIPYAAWVAFATYLNAGVWMLNP